MHAYFTPIPKLSVYLQVDSLPESNRPTTSHDTLYKRKTFDENH